MNVKTFFSFHLYFISFTPFQFSVKFDPIDFSEKKDIVKFLFAYHTVHLYIIILISDDNIIQN